jgi:protein-tyrosine-phosphatase
MMLTSDVILAAEPMHVDLISDLAHEVAARVHPLGEPLNLDCIPDPYGSGSNQYHYAAGLIRQAAEAWAVKLKAIVAASGWKPLADQ